MSLDSQPLSTVPQPGFTPGGTLGGRMEKRQRHAVDTSNLRRKRSGSWASAATILLGILLCLGWAAVQSAAQIGGTGSIEGTVTDPNGAVIGGAMVTATNTLTGVKTVDVTTKTGYFVIPLLQPGPYTVNVTASGFKTLMQENVIVDALATVALNPKLTIGTAVQSVTVTTEPSMLMTEDVKLGSNIENETYD